jgi:alpha-ribazole phosphatase
VGRSGCAYIDCFGGEMITMKWIWIRHGQTTANVARKYVGNSDVPLNELGRKQVSLIANKLTDESIQGVYSSDLIRCLETADGVGRIIGLSPVAFQELRELHFGQWELKTYEELMKTDRNRLESWYQNPFDIAPPGGETLSALGNRIDPWLQALMAKEENVAIVTHGGPIRWFLSKWVQGDASQFWSVDGVSHGEGIVAEWDGQCWKTKPIKQV